MRLTKPSREAYRLGPLLIDAQRLSIEHGKQSVAAAPLVVETLVTLCRHAGTFISKERLASALWPQGYVDDATLWQKIYLTRKLLEPYCGKGAIETLPRRGYRLTIQVTEAHHEAAPRRIAAGAAFAAPMLVAALSLMAVLSLRPAVSANPSPQAERAYNLGTYFERRGTIDGAQSAIREFRRAIALAPDDAPAYAGLALAFAQMSSTTNRRRDAFLDRAARYAVKALALDSRSAAAETVLSRVAFDRSLGDATNIRPGAMDASMNDARKAIALDPSYAPGHMMLGETYLVAGNIADAKRELERAIDLDPSLSAANVLLAQSAYDAGDYSSATTYATRAMAFGTSDQEDALLTLGLADVGQHKTASALAVFQKLVGYSRGLGLAARAYVEARTGEHRLALHDLRAATRDGSCDCAKFWVNVALANVALGRIDTATAMRITRSKAGYLAVRDDPRLRAVQ